MPQMLKDRQFRRKIWEEHHIGIREDFVEEEITFLRSRNDGYIMHYQVSLGWFIFRIDVLNIQGPAK